MWRLNIFKKETRAIKQIIYSNLVDSSSKVIDLTNRFSIRNRLILFFLLASLIPMLIVGTISYISSRNAMNSKISKYSQKEISHTITNLDIKLQTSEDISMQFLTVPQYNTTLEEFVEAQDTEAYQKGQNVYNLLQSFTFTKNELYLIFFLSLKDPTRFQSSGTAFSREDIQKLCKSKFYRNILQQNGKAVWSTLSLDQNNTLIAVGRKIKNVNYGDPLGVLIMFMKVDVISNVINNTEDSKEEKNSDEFTMITDDNGIIMVSPFQEDVNQNISKLIGSPKIILPLLTGKKDDDTFVTRYKNQKVLIMGKKVANRNLYIFNVSSTSYLYSESNLVGLISLCLGIFFGLIAIFISIVIALSISKPLNQVISLMQRAEKGDLTVRANIKRHDELGFLGTTFDHMMDQIGGLLKETQNAIETVSKHSMVLDESAEHSAKAAESVAAAMEEITRGTMEQTHETEKSSATMNDLASQIDVVVSKAGEVEQISGSTRELSLKSKEAVEQLILKTNETEQITQTIIQNIIDLHSSADRIRQITEVITGIAEQTNLLGLNASIEAARAGEMGQGFAVVSEEINKLALQSRDAAKTINNILQEIQTKTEISSKTAEEAHQILEAQRNAVNFAQDAFSEISTATGNIIARIIFINHLINNIHHSKEHTIQSIMSISSISEQTAASAEEVSASSEEQTALADQVQMLAQELRNQAEELSEVIKRFQV